MTALHVVVPAGVDDVARRSGGNVYDLRVCQELTAAGWQVDQIEVPGQWPRPGQEARAGLATALAALPDDAVVVLDGLVACGVPDVVVPQTRRLTVAVLVHLPLADETGLAASVAADLDVRERETLLAAATVVATSGWAADRLVSQHGLDRRRVAVVRPGVDPAPPARGTDGVSGLVCVAALTPRKGQDLLVEALASVTDPPWSCTFVGSPHRDRGYATRLRHLVAEHRLDDRVTFAGPLAGRQLAAAYSRADLVVLPSRAETYGMVVTESLARGVPVLASDVGGVTEALGVDPAGCRPGMLAPPDQAGFADGLRRWFDEPTTRSAWQQAALRRRGMLNGWAKTAQGLMNLLAQVR